MRALVTLISLAAILAAQAAEEATPYHNPVDKEDYRANWRTYTAKPTGTPAREGKVKMGTVRLLAEQRLFEQNASAETLAKFIVAAQARISAAVPKTAPAFALLVQFTLTANARPKIEMFSTGNASNRLLQAINDSLARVPDLRSKKDALPFQVQFVIRANP